MKPLMASMVLGAITDMKLPAEEELVATMADPNWRSLVRSKGGDLDSLEMSISHLTLLSTVLTVGGIFVFSKDDLPPGYEPDDMTDLPPLPFPMTWLEIEDAQPVECVFEDLDGRRSVFLGFAVIEEQFGRDWRILMPMLDVELLREWIEEHPRDMSDRIPMETLTIREFSIMWDERSQQLGLQVSEDDFRAYEALEGEALQRFTMVTRLPDYLVQLIHVLGATRERVEVPRPERRRFARAHGGAAHPEVYRVNLRSAGAEAEASSGDRVYHVRWLVRGHYRRDDGGKFNVEGKGRCAWVRPYVKGPPGAPWKGRPVYESVAS